MKGTTDFSIFRYEVPGQWYEGVFSDARPCCRAARPFSLTHISKADECWLLIHGYRGYPGELVRPAVDLYEAGYDVFVPRLPGHGTSGKDENGTHSLFYDKDPQAEESAVDAILAFAGK